MAKARAIIKRRKAVTNIRKITRTMQLIATARFQRAHNRALATKPYAEKLTELARLLTAEAGEISHPLLAAHDKDERHVLLVLTSNRGLCGGYNANLLRTGIGKLKELEGAGLTVELEVSGKKGISYCRFLRREMSRTYTEYDFNPSFADVAKIGERYIAAYCNQEIDAVHVVYMQFVSTGVQRPRVLQLLPLTAQPDEQRAAGAGAAGAEAPAWRYDFSPEPAKLLAELLPLSLKTQLFDCFTSASVSEQVARMVAMKAATDAAADMIKLLSTQYNRARQSQITLELLDIMGGSEAQK